MIIALLMMALFSLFESAFLSTNKLKLEIDKKSSPTFNKISTTFSRNRWFFRSFTFTGYTISLVVYTTTAINIFSAHTTLSIPIIIIIATLLVLFTIGYIPKTIINTDPNFYYRILSYPAWIFNIALYPISKITTLILKIILKIFKVEDENIAITEQFSKSDLAYLFSEVATDEQSEGSDAKDLKIMQNALEFSDIRIRDCMIPPADIEGLDINSTMNETKKMFVSTKFSRLP
ncbi:MAG: CNNM domain-containing protein, partial [Rikenellaceae bacterium]